MTLATFIDRSQKDRENWHYTDLAKLLKNLTPAPTPVTSQDITLPGDGVARFVFVDGVWQAGQSQLGDLPAGILQGDLQHGYRLILEGQTCLVTQPLEFLFLSRGDGQEITVPLRIELGANGRVTLIERHIAQGSCSTLFHTNITLHAQAKLVHGKIIDGKAATGAHLAMTQVDIAEGGYYDNFALIAGGRLTRNEIHVQMTGKLAQCRLNGAMLLSGSDHADTTTHITHAAPHGTSRQLYKTVLADKAHGVFQGKIIVAQDAQKTDGHQLSRALLLSDQAEMNAKPQLEIYADDVKCSHGTTVGELDAEALFYLRTRGLDVDQARALLLEAFIGEVADEIPTTEGRALAQAAIRRWLDDRAA
jgi:Fe-S cluster assembly protein SufD